MASSVDDDGAVGSFVVGRQERLLEHTRRACMHQVVEQDRAVTELHAVAHLEGIANDVYLDLLEYLRPLVRHDDRAREYWIALI